MADDDSSSTAECPEVDRNEFQNKALLKRKNIYSDYVENLATTSHTEQFQSMHDQKHKRCKSDTRKPKLSDARSLLKRCKARTGYDNRLEKDIHHYLNNTEDMQNEELDNEIERFLDSTDDLCKSVSHRQPDVDKYFRKFLVNPDDNDLLHFSCNTEDMQTEEIDDNLQFLNTPDDTDMDNMENEDHEPEVSR